jgi:maltose O-acetyltransferase
MGERCIVLPGASIGAGSRLVSGTVVTRRVPPGSLVAGVPAVVGPLPPAAAAGRPPMRGAVLLRGPRTIDGNDGAMLGEGPRWLQKASARARALSLFRQCDTGPHVHAYGNVVVRADGQIHLGGRVFFLGGMVPTELRCLPGARLSIGSDAGFNYGAVVEAHTSITIGDHCMIASGVTVCDSVRGASKPIVIEEGVWLAHGVTVLPGTVIGRRSVISAGSVVSGTIAPESFVVGNPARSLRLSALKRAA